MTDAAKIKGEEIPTALFTLMVPGFGPFPPLKLTEADRDEFVKRFLECGHVELAGHVIFASGIVLAKGTPTVIQKAPVGLKLG